MLGENGGGIEPQCYSRNVQLRGYILFQPGELLEKRVVQPNNNIDLLYLAVAFVHLLAMCMTAIMILHIRSKYTAVVRTHFPFRQRYFTRCYVSQRVRPKYTNID